VSRASGLSCSFKDEFKAQKTKVDKIYYERYKKNNRMIEFIGLIEFIGQGTQIWY
jgi:hypothetical protein